MILIIDDDSGVRLSLGLMLKQAGYKSQAAANAAEAMEKIQAQRPELILLDMNFSAATTGEEGLALLKEIQIYDASIPTILITGWASIDLAVRGIKAGARDFVAKPWNPTSLLQGIETILKLSNQKKQSLSRKKLDTEYNFEHIIGEDPALLGILESVGRISKTDASVLILGESGTGKELIAEAIHQNSRRHRHPFVKVNLGGIPANLFESELFGHKRGSFTGAHTDRVGRFEMANKGTIFLDEIGDTDLNNQVKLLRVLQDQAFEVLGSSQTKRVDVRVISATNKIPEDLIRDRKFREDLYYRINLITLRLPPLRERANDIPLLANFFINNLKELYGRPDLKVDRKALNWLKNLSFPGNIRQLKNLVERTVLETAGNELTLKHFQRQTQSMVTPQSTYSLPEVGTMTLEHVEIEMIKKALAFHNNKIAKAARSLGITRNALYRRLEKYNIPYEN